MSAMTAAGRYLQLATQRQSFLDRAREAAKLTIPTLVPPAGHGPQTKYYTPFQGLGAKGVNNLASKLLLALFPPNSPMFRLVIDDFTLQKMTGQEGMRAEVEKALNQIERSVMTDIEAGAVRVSAFEGLKQLIVAGNVLLFLPPGGGMRVFRLDRYVVSRDPSGTVLEIVVEEAVAPSTLPENIRSKLKQPESKDDTTEKTTRLYTRVRRTPKHWVVYQEIEGMVVPGSKGTYPLDNSPWLPLRWTKIDGEDYGRGYIEEYLGDLRSLEALQKAIVEGSAAAAKILFLVNPNGTTRLKDISETESGDVRVGNKEDVTVLQLEKYADFQIAFRSVETITQNLGMAFLMNTAIQRQGERVTAEEIRMMARELEDALGGVYSILSQEFQLPLVSRIMFQMEKQGRLPRLPKDAIKPTITTGLEALGRGQDLSKLQLLLQNLAPLGPEVIAQYLNVGDYITRTGTSIGIDMAGLVKSQQQMQQEAQQAQMQQMMDTLGPKGMDIVRDQLDPSKNGTQAQAQPANG